MHLKFLFTNIYFDQHSFYQFYLLSLGLFLTPKISHQSTPSPLFYCKCFCPTIFSSLDLFKLNLLGTTLLLGTTFFLLAHLLGLLGLGTKILRSQNFRATTFLNEILYLRINFQPKSFWRKNFFGAKNLFWMQNFDQHSFAPNFWDKFVFTQKLCFYESFQI